MDGHLRSQKWDDFVECCNSCQCVWDEVFSENVDGAYFGFLQMEIRLNLDICRRC